VENNIAIYSLLEFLHFVFVVFSFRKNQIVFAELTSFRRLPFSFTF
jgi:hypothetical protein